MLDPTDTRSRLVLTAMQLFWEKGYNSTSIADVLQTAKVNSGSLYHFFPGRAICWPRCWICTTRASGPCCSTLLGPASTIPSSGYLRCLPGIADHWWTPIASTAARSAASHWNCTNPTSRCASAWSRISALGSRPSMSACKRPGLHFASAPERRELAQFVLTTMEGGVMQARTFRDIAYFDASVRQLRRHVDAIARRGGSGAAQACGGAGAQEKAKK